MGGKRKIFADSAISVFSVESTWHISRYVTSALQKKQLPTQGTLKKNRRNTKNISFQFHYDKKLVSKSNLQDLITTVVQLEVGGGDIPCPFFRKSAQIVAIY